MLDDAGDAVKRVAHGSPTWRRDRVIPDRTMRLLGPVLALAATVLLFTPDAPMAQAARFFAPKAAGLALAAVVGAWSARRSALRWTPLDAMALAYGAWMIGSACLGVLPPLYACLDVTLQLAAYVLFRTTRSAIDGPDVENRLVDVLVIAACVTAALALAESLGVHWFDGGLRRPAALLGNRNFVAAALGCTLPLAVASALHRRSWPHAVASGLLLAVVILTRCRSVWLGSLVAAGVAVALTMRSPGRTMLRDRAAPLRWAALSLVIGGALAVLVPWPGLSWDDDAIAGSASRLLEHDRGSGAVRIEQHQLGLALMAEHPLGVGPRGWSTAASESARELLGEGREWTELTTPHSDPLRIGVEGGLPALLIVACALAVALAATARRWRHAPPSLPSLGAALGLLVMAIHSLLDAPLVRPDALAVIALLAALAAPAPAPAPAPTPPLAPTPALTFLALSLLFAVHQSQRALANALATRSASPDDLSLSLAILEEPSTALRHALAHHDAPDARAAAERAVRVAPANLDALRLATEAAERDGEEARAAELRARRERIGGPAALAPRRRR